MHTQEGEPRVRNWVDQVLHQMFPSIGQFEILSAKGYDPRFSLLARHDTDSIALKSRTIDQKLGTIFRVVGADLPLSVLSFS